MRAQLLLKHRECPLHVSQHVGELCRQQSFFRVDDHVGCNAACRPVPANRFAQTAPHAIALHRASQHSSHRKPNSKPIPLGPPQVKHRHMSGEMPVALLVYALKVRVPKQVRAARKCIPLARARPMDASIRSGGTHRSPSKPRLRALTCPAKRRNVTHGNQVSPRPACGPWRGGARLRPGRSLSSYEYEIRASSSDDAGWAEMCAWA